MPWPRWLVACATASQAMARRDRNTHMNILLATDAHLRRTKPYSRLRDCPWPRDSTVRVLTVVQPYPPPSADLVLAGGALEDIHRQQTAAAELIAAAAAEVVQSPRVAVQTVFRDGDPRNLVIDEADGVGSGPDRRRLARPHRAETLAAGQHRAGHRLARAVLGPGGTADAGRRRGERPERQVRPSRRQQRGDSRGDLARSSPR